MRNQLIYELLYVGEHNKSSFLFATYNAAIKFFEDCSVDNHLEKAIYLNIKQRGKDGMFHGKSCEVLYRQ